MGTILRLRIKRRLIKENETLTAAAKMIERERFTCEEDAGRALHAFCKKHLGSWHKITGTVQKHEQVRRPRGRPRKNEPPLIESHYTLSINIFPPDEARMAEIRRLEASFVLITNLLDTERWSDRDLLREYKGQHHVEDKFRFTKHPLIIDGVFLKSKSRVEALAYVVILAILVASVLEIRVRKSLAAAEEELQLEGQRHTDRPTSRALLEELNHLYIIRRETSDGVQRILPDNTHPRYLRILALAGYAARIYLQRHLF